MTPSLEELLAYQLGELGPEAEAALEERLFSDDALARRLDALARLGDGVRTLARSGRFGGGLTVRAVEELQRTGVRVRWYGASPGDVVPCTVEHEDLVVLRLRGPFASDAVDVTWEYRPVAGAPFVERATGVPVDAGTGELVLVSPGERIRALPRTRVRIVVSGTGGEPSREFGLDHTPSM